MVAWQPIGVSMGVFDMSHSYLFERKKERKKESNLELQWFQLNQEKLVRMLGNIETMVLVGW